jgi:hypothetical protein
MEVKRRWIGWIAIGLGALALVVALLGRGFGPGIAAAGRHSANAQQSYAQPGPGPQSNQAAPGANAQPEAGRQGAGAQNGAAAPGAEARRETGRPGNAGFRLGRWFGFPLKLIGGLFQLGMLALLIVLGMWLIRNRSSAAPNSGHAEPAQSPPQAPLSPTGESYLDEPSDRE